MPEIPKTYVQRDGTIPAICPACGAEQRLPSERIEARCRPFEARCPCGNTFPVLAEFRKAYRRPVNLSGTYIEPSSQNEQENILIRNMSMTGVGFVPVQGHRISKGDAITLRFTLGNDQHTKIETRAVVAHASDQFVGCWFEGLSAHQEDALASYLMTIP